MAFFIGWGTMGLGEGIDWSQKSVDCNITLVAARIQKILRLLLITSFHSSANVLAVSGM